MTNIMEEKRLLAWCRRNGTTPDGNRKCILCSREVSSGGRVGVFVADEESQRRLGAPKGKARVVIYLLCKNCWEVKDRDDRVEEKIFGAWQVN